MVPHQHTDSHPCTLAAAPRKGPRARGNYIKYCLGNQENAVRESRGPILFLIGLLVGPVALALSHCQSTVERSDFGYLAGKALAEFSVEGRTNLNVHSNVFVLDCSVVGNARSLQK